MWIWLLASMALVVVLAVTLQRRRRRDVVHVAEVFFRAVRHEDMARAHACLARDFRARTNEHTLRELLARIAVLRCRRAEWSQRAVDRHGGELVGVIVNDTGGLVPVRLAMIREGGRWRIRSIARTSPGAAMAGEHRAERQHTPPSDMPAQRLAAPAPTWRTTHETA